MKKDCERNKTINLKVAIEQRPVFYLEIEGPYQDRISALKLLSETDRMKNVNY